MSLIEPLDFNVGPIQPLDFNISPIWPMDFNMSPIEPLDFNVSPNRSKDRIRPMAIPRFENSRSRFRPRAGQSRPSDACGNAENGRSGLTTRKTIVFGFFFFVDDHSFLFKDTYPFPTIIFAREHRLYYNIHFGNVEFRYSDSDIQIQTFRIWIQTLSDLNAILAGKCRENVGKIEGNTSLICPAFPVIFLRWTNRG